MADALNEEGDALHEVKLEQTRSQLIADQIHDRSPSPPSSPPIEKLDASDSQEHTPPRKRSHEEMNVDSDNANDSSMTIVDTVDPDTTVNTLNQKDTDPSTEGMANAHAHTMAASSASASNMPPPAQRPLHSRENSQNKQPQSGQLEKFAQDSSNIAGENSDENDEMSDADETEEAPSSSECRDEIEDFDWADLQRRYHAKVGELNNSEKDILQDFENLCNYFSIWAQAGSAQEVDRSFKRMKTQMTLVQHHEDELEQKRIHYTKVVNAFKSALDLLR